MHGNQVLIRFHSVLQFVQSGHYVIYNNNMANNVHEYVLIANHFNNNHWSFSVTAPHAWNSLPSDVRSCHTVDTFKQNLKNHLFRQS